MTPSLPKVAEMSDEEMNIEIAKACGWTGITMHGASGGEYGVRPQGSTPDSAWREVPDYCADLNAMHAAIVNLPPLSAATVTYELGKIATEHGVSFCECLPIWWAKAFLLATGRARA